MNGYFIVADLRLDIQGELLPQIVDASWAHFSVKQNPTEQMDFTLLYAEQKSTDYLVERCSLPDGMQQAYRYGPDVVLANRDFSLCTMLPLVDRASFSVLSNHIFYTHAVQRQMLQLHCATIEDHGRGILFLGPSGIGKTTQAERWAQYRGATIINGDIGFVQHTPQGYTAWGTPWHGSSPYCLNTSVPVKALVVLKQAPENRLRELTGFEKVQEVSGSVFYPTWLEDGMELCTDTLNHLLTDLPVYRLDNRADEEAVRLLAAELDRIT